MQNGIKRSFKVNIFWRLQFIGWSIFLASEWWNIWNSHKMSLQLAIQFIGVYLILFLLILLIRIAYCKIYSRTSSIFYTILIVFGASSMIGVIWVFLREGLLDLTFNDYRLWVGIMNKGFAASVFAIIRATWVPFVWSILYFAIKTWQDIQIEKERVKDAVFMVQEAQLQTLRYKLNPHFLFNSLNSIQALFRENPDQADLMITELSEFLRYSLKYNDRLMIPVKDEMDIINKYLTIEKIRYEEKLDFSINIDNNALHKEIPCLITQPLVENSIKHGLYKDPSGIKIEINILYIQDIFRIEVINTGKLQSGWTYGIGLKNVVDRLENLYKDRFDFSITETDKGVLAKIEILMLNNEKTHCRNNR